MSNLDGTASTRLEPPHAAHEAGLSSSRFEASAPCQLEHSLSVDGWECWTVLAVPGAMLIYGLIAWYHL
jgi:hypothetical protein